MRETHPWQLYNRTWRRVCCIGCNKCCTTKSMCSDSTAGPQRTMGGRNGKTSFQFHFTISFLNSSRLSAMALRCKLHMLGVRWRGRPCKRALHSRLDLRRWWSRNQQPAFSLFIAATFARQSVTCTARFVELPRGECCSMKKVPSNFLQSL